MIFNLPITYKRGTHMYTWPSLGVAVTHCRVMTQRNNSIGTVKCDCNPGSVLEKKIDRGGSAYFLGLKFFKFLFFWVWKNLSYFFGSKDFSLIFLGNNFDTIYFFGCPIKRS